jgi:hypothetical protein
MATFNLADYETVEQRHARVIAEYPDLRSVIINHTTAADRAVGTWVVEARVYLNADDQAADLPKAVDWAFEVDGQGMANKTSALENASTSALGRALRWAFAGSKGPTRQEMEKVERGQTPKPARDWLAEAQETLSVDKLRAIYADARKAGAEKTILDQIAGAANALAATQNT